MYRRPLDHTLDIFTCKILHDDDDDGIYNRMDQWMIKMISQNVGNQRWSPASGGKQSLTEVADCNPAAGEAMPLACGPVKEVKDWGDGETPLAGDKNGAKCGECFLTKIRGVKTHVWLV